MPRKTVEERFWEKVDRQGGDECWEWLAGRTPGGYGQFHTTTTVRAHRYAYELLVGPIPEGLQIDHLCRVRNCVNPAHMEIVTLRENVLRGEGPPARNARKTHCKRGHELNEENTYVNAKGRWCRVCRREYERRGRAVRKAAGLPTQGTLIQCSACGWKGRRLTDSLAPCPRCGGAVR